MVRYNFESYIIFYDILGNKNGELIHQVYVDFILEPVVKSWITAGKDFVFEEDGISSHGLNKKNLICKWKQQNCLKSYFSLAYLPEMSVMENC